MKAVEAVLRQQEKLNKKEDYSIIDRRTGELIHALVEAKNPKNVLEIGTSIGYSSIWIASALKKGKLTTIERWDERAELAKKFFKKAKLKVNLIEGEALEIIPKLKTKFDVVFLDATKSEYLKYLKKVKLNKNALIIADNILYPKDIAAKLKDFMNYVNKKGALTLNIGKGLTIFTNS